MPEEHEIITVSVIDDDAHIRHGLWWLLNNIVDVRCLGTYANLSDAMEALVKQTPDILLLDAQLPGESGIDAIQPFLSRFLTLRIIMHSNYDEEDKIYQAMKAGASGYVLKNASAPALYDAILQVFHGESVWPHGYTEDLLLRPTGRQSFVKSWIKRPGLFFSTWFSRLKKSPARDRSPPIKIP